MISFAKAFEHHQENRIDQARKAYLSLLKKTPQDHRARYYLGLAQFQGGQLEQALVSVSQAMEGDGSLPDAIFNKGTILMGLQRWPEAVECFELCLLGDSAHCKALLNLGISHMHSHQFNSSIRCFDSLLQMQPGNWEALYNLGLVYQQKNHLEKALDCYSEVLTAQPDFEPVMRQLAVVYYEQGKVKKAATLYQELLEKKPNLASEQNNLANCFRDMGELEQARDIYLGIIRNHPDYVLAYYNLVQLENVSLSETVISHLEKLLAGQEKSNSLKTYLAFTLAKMSLQKKEYSRAYDFYQQANKLHRTSLLYDGKAVALRLHRLQKTFNKTLCQKFSSRAGGSEQQYIFIVGMPRSGTTLVEQIISAHSSVTAGGELTCLSDVVEQSGMLVEHSDIVREDLAVLLTPEVLSTMAESYCQKVKQIYPDYMIVTDKMPTNFWHIGFIAAMFPNAKIIHCQRDLRDVFVSCYSTYFTQGQYFSFDPEELKQFILHYCQMMRHWQSVIPEEMLFTVKYESLVEESEATIKQLLAFCDLTWQETCLSPHKNVSSVATASAAQVRKPIHVKSVARWKVFETWFADIFYEFQEAWPLSVDNSS